MKAKTLPRARAVTATMMVKGDRRAKTIGFMLLPRRWRGPRRAWAGPVLFQQRGITFLEAGDGVLVLRHGLGGLPQRAVQAELRPVVVADGAVIVAVGLGEGL